MTEVPVCESLRCVFLFIYFSSSSFFSLSCVIVGSAMVYCFLEVVASSAGEKGGAYGSQDSHQVVSAQRNKETQQERPTAQSSICRVCKH